MYNLSIIIPHYNCSTLLEKLLLSIPKMDDIEVIVVDDNSRINEIQYIEQLLNSENLCNFRFLHNNRIKGAGTCRNIGVENALGTYLLFADSDDYFTDNAFDIIQKYLNSSYEIVFFSPTSFNDTSLDLGTRHYKYSNLVTNYINQEDDDIRYKFYVPWSKLILKSLVVNYNISFDEIIASNDINFSLKIGFYGKNIYATDETIYCVRETSNSLTRQITENVVDSRFDALSRYNDFLCSNGLEDKQGEMLIHLWNTRYFGVYKFLFRFFYCKYKKYPIFYSFKQMMQYFKN